MVLKKWIGNKAFYKRLLVLTLPIMLQNGITNFVNLLDNIMIGRVGTAEMTGVSVANQLFLVFNICIFGACSGAGIFGAQFFGKGDHEGVRHTFRIKLIVSALFTALALGIFLLFGDPLIGLFLKGEGTPAEAAAALEHGRAYLQIMLIGIFPYAIAQCYSGTLRENNQPLLPMTASFVAVFTNLVLNYILIFGKFGAPALGVKGAAIATVISRFVELGVDIVWARINAKKNPFIIGAFRSLYVPGDLLKKVLVKGFPLIVNDSMWALGNTLIVQGYSLKGLDVVAALNISQTFWNFFSMSFMAIGVSIGIILGQHLGAGETALAKEECRKLLVVPVVVGLVVGGLYAICANFIPLAYNTEPEVRELATRLMQISAMVMPLEAYSNAAYYVLRSGGRMLITLFVDAFPIWAINLPLAMLLPRYTSLPILAIYAIVQFAILIKCIYGSILVNKGIWVRNIIEKSHA